MIISDAYESPTELYNYFKDSSIFSFSNNLKTSGWYVNNRAFSFEKYTVYSLSSIFNYNLSLDTTFNKESENEITSKYILKSKLFNDLKKLNVKIINYGIFDIGSYKPLTRMYYYPKNFGELFLSNTIYFFAVANNISSENTSVFNSFPIENHNKKILTSLSDTVSKIYNEKYFIYAHLYMPHSPMVYLNEFPFKSLNTINYLNYWKFTNAKLTELLNQLTKSNKYRIILTGDHGFRSNLKINPQYTFSAYFGFENNQIDSTIFSIQDIGRFIFYNY